MKVQKPVTYRTSDGIVYHNGSKCSLHAGLWWWDVGCPIIPEGLEYKLPLWPQDTDEQGD